MISRFRLEEYLVRGYQVVEATELEEKANDDLFVRLRRGENTTTVEVDHEAWELALKILGRLPRSSVRG